MDEIFLFYDMDLEHILMLGPGGWSFASFYHDGFDDAFLVGGEDNAKSLQAFLKNEGIHTRYRTKYAPFA